LLFICGHAPIRRRPHLESNGQRFICSKSLVLSTTMPPPRNTSTRTGRINYTKNDFSVAACHIIAHYTRKQVYKRYNKGQAANTNRWYFVGNPAALPIGVPPADATIRCARQWSVGRSLDRSRRRGMDGDRRQYTTLTAAGMM